MSGPRTGFRTRFNSALHGCWTGFSSQCASFASTLKANFVPALISAAGRLPTAGLAVFTITETMNKFVLGKNEETSEMDPETIALCSVAFLTSLGVSCVSKIPATFNKLKGNVKATTDEEDELLKKKFSDFKSFKSKTAYTIVKGAGGQCANIDKFRCSINGGEASDKGCNNAA